MRHRWLALHAELFETSVDAFERQAKANSPLEKIKITPSAMGRSSSAREIPHNTHGDPTHLNIPGSNRSSMLVNPTTPTHVSTSRKRHTVQVEYDQPAQTEGQLPRQPSTKGMEEIRSLGVPPAPSLARSITATGIAGSHSPKLLSPLDEDKALNPSATLSESVGSRGTTSRLPIPQGKPRPTSYQVPATSYLPSLSNSANISRVVSSGSKDSERGSLSRSASQKSARPGSQYGRADNYIAPTVSEPKSTPANADGELSRPMSPPNENLARPNKKDQKKRTSMAGAERFFNKLWVNNNSPSREEKSQRRFSLFASSTSKNQSMIPVSTTSGSIPALAEPTATSSKSSSPTMKSKGVKHNKKFNDHAPVDKSDKASSSAAKRVMDFFKNRRIFKDTGATNAMTSPNLHI
ncbi:Serine/threonine-protein kinase ppk1 [Neolecta irregularis DAH-3]|uniref:Serine/threonine-protein kinase ppk1 n=1 Tax=Neolecta irregularis (strain DAH-3) TaxID=1198029 RepID=A0A1U7LU94_NEOID|nr:Serine/threonine-protein kinase ppk1 [Neolecta irregularis DAH-3]|eukprot:OLL26246.1 Serine/threonine-protein kinase ppk1 [Neolecta irregularis DAH-3]